MNTRAYLNYFFPFTPVPLTIHPGGGTIDLPDQTSFAIMMTYHNEPEAMALSFMRGYSERVRLADLHLPGLGIHLRERIPVLQGYGACKRTGAASAVPARHRRL